MIKIQQSSSMLLLSDPFSKERPVMKENIGYLFDKPPAQS